MLILAGEPHANETLCTVLMGQILWVEYSQLVPIAIVYLILLCYWRFVTNLMGAAGLYLIFAVAITLSVQVVGVYLVFGSLIIPALATVKWQTKKRIIMAYLMGQLVLCGWTYVIDDCRFAERATDRGVFRAVCCHCGFDSQSSIMLPNNVDGGDTTVVIQQRVSHMG